LLQSGLRIEEACELTKLDIIKRRHTDGRSYYLLHVKPSKFDRARVLPIGDGLGRVIGQIIRHVKAFYGTTEVPPCDGWDSCKKQAGPHATVDYREGRARGVVALPERSKHRAGARGDFLWGKSLESAPAR
jgi:hypothetical protein